MKNGVRVWDIPTRLFHWTLASLFVFLIVSGSYLDNMMQWHMRAGYAILGLITFRILWGIVGSHYARFTQFLSSPVRALRYLYDLLKGDAGHHLGHNPAGGWMVILLIFGIGLQAFTGLFMTDDILWEAPFYNSVSDDLSGIAAKIHHQLQNFLQGFVALHILAVLWHRFRYKDPLIGAMLHGNKPKSEEPEVQVSVNYVLLAVIIGISGALVYWLWSQPI